MLLAAGVVAAALLLRTTGPTAVSGTRYSSTPLLKSQANFQYTDEHDLLRARLRQHYYT